MSASAFEFSERLRDPNQVRDGTLLGVCASAKPSSGGSRSACRSYLSFMLNKLNGIYPSVLFLDLEESPLPFFQGQSAEDCGEPNAALAGEAVRRAAALLLAVPAYWNSVGGVFKNFCDLLGGAAYDQPSSSTAFDDKPVGLLIVGADPESSTHGEEHACAILAALGARLVSEPLVIANPRTLSPEEWMGLTPRFVELAVTTAKAAHLTTASSPR